MSWKSFATISVGFGVGSLAFAITKERPLLVLEFWTSHIEVWLAALAVMSHLDEKRGG